VSPAFTDVGAKVVTDRSALAGPAAVTASEKLVAAPPGTEAVTMTAPACPAVTVGLVATPDALVVTVAVLAPPGNVADPEVAAAAGRVNFTGVPAVGLPYVSVTVATSGSAKPAPAVAVCATPDVAVMLTGPAAATEMTVDGPGLPERLDVTVNDPARVDVHDASVHEPPGSLVVNTVAAVTSPGGLP